VASIAGGHERRGDARKFGGGNRVWWRVVGRSAVVVSDLAARKRDDSGGFSHALAAISDASGEFEI